MSVDSIGDFLTIIRNGVMASKPSVQAPHSRMREQLVDLMKQKGFIRDYQVTEEEAGKKRIKVVLKYVEGESVIHEIKRVSTPGIRSYTGIKNVKPVIGGLGMTVLSTSRGLLAQDQAKAQRVGGEVICTMW